MEEVREKIKIEERQITCVVLDTSISLLERVSHCWTLCCREKERDRRSNQKNRKTNQRGTGMVETGGWSILKSKKETGLAVKS